MRNRVLIYCCDGQFGIWVELCWCQTSSVAVLPSWLPLQLPSEPSRWSHQGRCGVETCSLHVPRVNRDWSIYCLLYCDNNAVLCQLCPVLQHCTRSHCSQSTSVDCLYLPIPAVAGAQSDHEFSLWFFARKKKKKASVRWLQLGNWVYATHYRCRWLEVVVKMVWCWESRSLCRLQIEELQAGDCLPCGGWCVWTLESTAPITWLLVLRVSLFKFACNFAFVVIYFVCGGWPNAHAAMFCELLRSVAQQGATYYA